MIFIFYSTPNHFNSRHESGTGNVNEATNEFLL